MIRNFEMYRVNNISDSKCILLLQRYRIIWHGTIRIFGTFLAPKFQKRKKSKKNVARFSDYYYSYL